MDSSIFLPACTDSRQKPSSSKKTVRIKTPPPLSPDSPGDTLIRRVSNGGRTGSPPRRSLVDLSGLKDDPFLSREFAADILFQQSSEVIDNTRRNSETTAKSPSTAVTQALNPFHRTLANTEPQNIAQTPKYNASDAQVQDRITPTSEGQQRFDVHSFTKMMSTGATPAVNLHKSEGYAESQNESSQRAAYPKEEERSAIPSSSHPSGSDPSSGSYAELSSATSDNGSDRGDNIGERNLKNVSSFKQPPPPPKHRHGRSTQLTEPQTVSFNDFDSSTTSRSTSDYPFTGRDAQRSSSRQVVDLSAKSTRMTPDGTEKSKQSSGPPPIPISRRSGSVRSKSGQDTETSSINSNRPWSPEDGPLSPGAAKSNKAPPPPPSRKAGQRISLPADHLSASELASLASGNASPGEDSLSTDSSAFRAVGSESIVGSRNSSGSMAPNSHMAPPPPPRRRRGSSKSSMEEGRRPSQESNRHVSGLSQVSEQETDSRPPLDVLADLSAFQAEVEALRAESLRRAS